MAAGVALRTGPTDNGIDDPNGYRVFLSAYPEADLTAMFELSTTLFEEYGLGTPTSFRAGAWNADIGVMRALGYGSGRIAHLHNRNDV